MAARNNPYELKQNAETYDRWLRAPIIRTLRREEGEALRAAFDRLLGKDDTVLEVGAGTGYYSFDIARRVKKLTLLEPSAAMVAILREKLKRTDMPHLKIVQHDLFTYDASQQFDHVVAIGVLDYIADGKKFLETCLRHAQKSVIVTVPRKGLWSSIYKLASRLRGVSIYAREPEDFRAWIKDYNVSITEAGLQTRLTRGLTLIVTIEKPTQEK